MTEERAQFIEQLLEWTISQAWRCTDETRPAKERLGYLQTMLDKLDCAQAAVVVEHAALHATTQLPHRDL